MAMVIFKQMYRAKRNVTLANYERKVLCFMFLWNIGVLYRSQLNEITNQFAEDQKVRLYHCVQQRHAKIAQRIQELYYRLSQIDLLPFSFSGRKCVSIAQLLCLILKQIVGAIIKNDYRHTELPVYIENFSVLIDANQLLSAQYVYIFLGKILGKCIVQILKNVLSAVHCFNNSVDHE